MRPGSLLAARLAIAGLGLVLGGQAALAQTPGWTRAPSLRFFGFRAGMAVEDAAGGVAAMSGTSLSCDRSTVDLRVSDCRATFPDPITGDQVQLWLSALDSLVAVLTVSGVVTPIQLEAWRSSLVSAYGEVVPVQQGAQYMLQWVRHRQMLRLTWRELVDSTTASVSLVDGPLLDGWHRDEAPP